jgi:hypothetical protein
MVEFMAMHSGIRIRIRIAPPRDSTPHQPTAHSARQPSPTLQRSSPQVHPGQFMVLVVANVMDVIDIGSGLSIGCHVLPHFCKRATASTVEMPHGFFWNSSPAWWRARRAIYYKNRGPPSSIHTCTGSGVTRGSRALGWAGWHSTYACLHTTYMLRCAHTHM